MNDGVKIIEDIPLCASDSYSPAPVTDADDGALSSRAQDSKAISVEAVEFADDEGKLEIDDQCEEDDNEDGDGDKTPPVSSTVVQEYNKKEELDTGECTLFSTVLYITGSCPIFVQIFE
jgi:hypothetical protein